MVLTAAEETQEQVVSEPVTIPVGTNQAAVGASSGNTMREGLSYIGLVLLLTLATLLLYIRRGEAVAVSDETPPVAPYDHLR